LACAPRRSSKKGSREGSVPPRARCSITFGSSLPPGFSKCSHTASPAARERHGTAPADVAALFWSLVHLRSPLEFLLPPRTKRACQSCAANALLYR